MKAELKYDIILFTLGALEIIYAVLCFAIVNGIIGTFIILFACVLIIYDLEGGFYVK